MSQRDPRYPAVGMGGDLAPFNSPQRVDPIPHNLPPMNARPVLPSMIGGGAGSMDEQIRDPHHYATVVDLTLPVGNTTATTGNPILLQPSSKRNFLAIRNTSALANIYLGFDKPADLNSTFKLGPGTIILFDTVTPQNDLYAFADAAGGQISFAYSNINN